MKDFLEKRFKLSEYGTTVKTELVAGLTTFMTMAYILAVNPSVLSSAGIDSEAVLLATCMASFLGCFVMGLAANLPFALSAGMGLNAYLTYTVVFSMGYTWQTALLAVFIEGIIFIVLSLTKVREAIFECIPLSLKRAVSVGIGLFIAFIGLQNAGLVVSSATLVSLTNFREDFHTRGICALLALAGTILMIVLYIKKVPGSILAGIFGTWIMGLICQFLNIYRPDAEMGYNSLVPTFKMTDFTAISKTFGACFNADIKGIGIFNFIVVVFSFLFVDLFDTIGTLIGVASKADMLDENGKLRGIRSALMADAVATTAGAVLGTSTVSTFVESAAGVGAGGRTGLAAVVTGVLFLISTLLAPIFIAIPSFATAPALILVGFLMFSTIAQMDFGEGEDKLTQSVPAYICIISMPLFYSISEGISFGVISYVLINLFCGKKKNLNPVLCVTAVLFVLKYIFL